VSSRPSRAVLSHRERGIVLALLLSLLLWQLPAGGLVLYPFKLLATWIHEMSHGLTMLATGAGFESLEIYEDTSGIAHASSGTSTFGRALIASSGYMGASLLGAVLLVISQSGRRARVALIVIGAAMLLSAWLWVDNRFGFIVSAVGGLLFVGSAIVLRERWASWALSFVAAQACINAVLDIRILFRAKLVINGEIAGASDAHRMAETTFGGPSLWAGLWLAWSFALFFVALRIAHVRERRAKPKDPTD